MLSKHAVLIQATLITLAMPALSTAGEFQHQASLSYFTYKGDADTYAYEGKSISMAYLFTFAPAKTDGIILNEALFLNKSSGIAINGTHRTSEHKPTMGNNRRSHENSMVIEGNWVTDNDLVFGLGYDTPVSDEEATSYSLYTMLGAYLNDQTLIAASVEQDRYKNTYWNETNYSYSLMLKSIVPLSDSTALAIIPGASFADGTDDFMLGATYYFNHRVGLGATYLKSTGDWESDNLNINYNHYLTESLGLDITLSHSKSDSSDADMIRFAMNYRY